MSIHKGRLETGPLTGVNAVTNRASTYQDGFDGWVTGVNFIG
jgi:hypothetical protein